MEMPSFRRHFLENHAHAVSSYCVHVDRAVVAAVVVDVDDDASA